MLVKFVVVNFILLSKKFYLKIVYSYVIEIDDSESNLGLCNISRVSELLIFSKRTTNANASNTRNENL